MISSQLRWQPQKLHQNVLVRTAILPIELTWQTLHYDHTDFTGIWLGSFESDNEVQDNPITMLTRFDSGGFVPLHGHPGGEEILVLQGNFVDETGKYPPGSYLLNPDGFVHLPHSEEGCLSFVKLGQHGGKTRQQVNLNIYELPWQASVIPQVDVKPLYEQAGFPEKVWIERWQAGTTFSNIVETEVKEIFVIEGTLSDELGNYPAGSWLRYPPGCSYNPSSITGCMIYVKTYPKDTRRFIFEENSSDLAYGA